MTQIHTLSLCHTLSIVVNQTNFNNTSIISSQNYQNPLTKNPQYSNLNSSTLSSNSNNSNNQPIQNFNPIAEKPLSLPQKPFVKDNRKFTRILCSGLKNSQFYTNSQQPINIRKLKNQTSAHTHQQIKDDQHQTRKLCQFASKCKFVYQGTCKFKHLYKLKQTKQKIQEQQPLPKLEIQIPDLKLTENITEPNEDEMLENQVMELKKIAIRNQVQIPQKLKINPQIFKKKNSKKKQKVYKKQAIRLLDQIPTSWILVGLWKWNALNECLQKHVMRELPNHLCRILMNEKIMEINKDLIYELINSIIDNPGQEQIQVEQLNEYLDRNSDVYQL